MSCVVYWWRCSWGVRERERERESIKEQYNPRVHKQRHHFVVPISKFHVSSSHTRAAILSSGFYLKFFFSVFFFFVPSLSLCLSLGPSNIEMPRSLFLSLQFHPPFFVLTWFSLQNFHFFFALIFRIRNQNKSRHIPLCLCLSSRFILYTCGYIFCEWTSGSNIHIGNWALIFQTKSKRNNE